VPWPCRVPWFFTLIRNLVYSHTVFCCNRNYTLWLHGWEARKQWEAISTLLRHFVPSTWCKFPTHTKSALYECDKLSFTITSFVDDFLLNCKQLPVTLLGEWRIKSARDAVLPPFLHVARIDLILYGSRKDVYSHWSPLPQAGKNGEGRGAAARLFHICRAINNNSWFARDVIAAMLVYR
jgi:hypothetical protein